MAQTQDQRVPVARGDGDWTVQAADKVEQLVTTLHDRTAVPLGVVARAIVYGLLALIMGTATLVLVIIGFVRVVDAYLPGQVWAAHALVGGIFTVLGGLLLRKANTNEKR